MADEAAIRDPNHIPVLLLEKDDGSGDTIMARGDASGRLKATATVSAVAPSSATYVTLSTNATLTNERVLTGTANQVVLTDNGAGSTIVLSLPQSIATTSTPTFASMTLTAASSLTLGTASTNTGAIILKNSSNANTTTLQAGAAGANIVFTLPTDDGDNGEVLTTNGSGVLSWELAGSGANTALSNLASVALNTALLPDAAAADDFGSATLPFKDLFLAGSSGTPGTNNFRLTGASTSGTRVITLPDASATLVASVTTGNGVSATNTAGALAFTLGAITPTTVNGVTITATSGTLNITNAKTLAVTNTLTLSGTDSTVMTFPSTSATIARIDAANTFVGASTASAWVLTSPTITTKISPTSDDGAPLGDTTHNFSDLFLASGAVVNYANSNVVLTHTSGVLTLGTGNLIVTTAGTAAGSVATISGTQTLTNKDLTATNNSFTAASTTQSGVAEASIASEVNTGTDAARYVSPDSLAGSNIGTKVLEVTAFDYTTDTATGDGKGYVIVPACMAGMDLVAVNARVITAGTTNTTDIQVRNVTQTADMLSTKMTIDSAEVSTTTAATPPVIDGNNDDVAAYDLLAIDVDAVSTTAAKGLIVTLEFRLP